MESVSSFDKNNDVTYTKPGKGKHHKVSENFLDFYRKKHGDLRRHYFYSKTLKNKRQVDVYLPPGYNYNLDRHYPVLYMHDGNNLFDPASSFGGVHWNVDTTADYLINHNMISEIIIVGIHNTPDRDYEYTWTQMFHEEDGYTEGGGGKKYARFMVHELKPFIDQCYRTIPFRESTAVMGSSLGGLISFYLGLHYPAIFSKIGVMSPSLWWGDGIIFRHIKKLPHDLEIWLDMGTKEYDPEYEALENNENMRSIRKLKNILLKRGYVEGKNLGYYEHIDAEHNEWFWGERLHLSLLFFFSK